ncbi:NrsF family protein [Ramlibacter sp.]|uniref:NrsF family protein n=1 Tax=Ramlibacter sp. TaxID=1917967 RepID=UPI003D0B2D3A
MKTDDLIRALAADDLQIDPTQAERRFFGKLAAGAMIAVAAMLLLMGTRADLNTAAFTAMFWMKLLFPASLAVAALAALRRLSYPGMRLGRVPAAAALPLALVWMMAGLALSAAPAGERLALVLGETWIECPFNIALLSVPALGLAFWATRGLAPTRLSLAGAAAGLFAGAVAALAYALHCPEMQAPFLAVWYGFGMLIPTGAGALLGRRILNW